MRLITDQGDTRSFRDLAPEELFFIALVADEKMRDAIEHELDRRRAKCLAGRIPPEFFEDEAWQETSCDELC